MRRLLALIPLVLATAGCSLTGRAPTRLSSWPDDPCAVLTGDQVAAASGITVARVRRAPSVGKIVQASRTGGDPGPGQYICVYETTSAHGDLTIIAPAESQRSSDGYWAAREAYFRQFSGSARPIANLGEDAWLAAGTTLHVLARRDLHFTVAARMYQDGVDGILTALARAVLARF